MTFTVTVFEVALPFFGVTVTVTLHVPALMPLSVVPDTLQYLAELDTAFSDTFDVESTVSLANVAIDLAVADLRVVTAGVLVKPATVTVCQPVQFPALSLTRISTDVAADFRTPLDDTDSDKSTKGTETLAA